MVKKRLKKYWFLLVLLAVVLMRLPSLFEPFTYGDEGIYLTLGQALRKGLVWYRDIHDNKPPLLYLLAALAGNFSRFRLLLFFWSLTIIFVFYQLAQIIFRQNKSAVIIATTTFALLSSTHTFEANVANAENFMLLFTLGGVLAVLNGLGLIKPNRRRQTWWFFWSGVLLALATLFKVPGAFDLAALAVFIWLVFLEKKGKQFRLLLTRLFLLTLGFCLPLLATIIYYAWQGALGAYLKIAFFQNLPYLSSWAGGEANVGGLPAGLLFRGLLVFGLIAVLFWLKKRVAWQIKLILLWFAFSLLAATLSGRPYPHYLIQVLPAFCLGLGFFDHKKKRTLSLAFLVILLGIFLNFNFWYYSNLPYYANFYQFALGLKSKEAYFTSFDPQALSLYQMADYLRQRNRQKEKIFIWGTKPSIYALADRLPVGRYTTSYHIIDFHGYQETLTVLKANPPRYLIVVDDEKRPFPELFTFITRNYVLEKQIDGLQLFHRII